MLPRNAPPGSAVTAAHHPRYVQKTSAGRPERHPSRLHPRTASGRQDHVGSPAATRRSYISFDDTTLLAAARFDPIGFVAGLPEHVTLDEVQRVPELLMAIKLAVDNDRRPGRCILTGSANRLLLPGVQGSLAGRMEVI